MRPQQHHCSAQDSRRGRERQHALRAWPHRARAVQWVERLRDSGHGIGHGESLVHRRGVWVDTAARPEYLPSSCTSLCVQPNNPATKQLNQPCCIPITPYIGLFMAPFSLAGFVLVEFLFHANCLWLLIRQKGGGGHRAEGAFSGVQHALRVGRGWQGGSWVGGAHGSTKYIRPPDLPSSPRSTSRPGASRPRAPLPQPKSHTLHHTDTADRLAIPTTHAQTGIIRKTSLWAAHSRRLCVVSTSSSTTRERRSHQPPTSTARCTVLDPTIFMVRGSAVVRLIFFTRPLAHVMCFL